MHSKHILQHERKIKKDLTDNWEFHTQFSFFIYRQKEFQSNCNSAVTGVDFKNSTSRKQQLNTALQRTKYIPPKCTEAIIMMWVGTMEALHL